MENAEGEGGRRLTQGHAGEADEALRLNQVRLHREVHLQESDEASGGVDQRVRHEAAVDGSALRIRSGTGG